MFPAPMTVVETPSFLRDAASRITEDERVAIVSFLAANPQAGDLMVGTGGIRKLRWGTKGRGKSGGVRVIYYFHSDPFPLFLLNVFAKNEKANLTNAERNELKTLTSHLLNSYRQRKSK